MTTNNPATPDDHNTADDNVCSDLNAATDPAPETAVHVRSSKQHDPDAAWGVKTKKGGGEEVFFGYHEHTVVRVPDGKNKAAPEAPLITRFELVPASTDFVDVSLSLLDRLPTPAETLIVDRLYPYATPERWRDPLVERGIDQVFDLRSDQHGFVELNHTRWAAGWPHCPATPDQYGSIPRPAPSAPPADKQTFRRRIAARQQYALRRVTTPDADGTARWECPAVAGSIGCPLRQGTVPAHMELGGAIVENPPDPDSPDFPVCCSQRTVTIQPGPLRKLMQHHYWGSETWEIEYAKRTYVEGVYGNRKNPSTEDVRRGYHRLVGIALVHIAIAMSAAAYNLRIMRNWHREHGGGDPDHPLLRQAERAGGWMYISPEDADARAHGHPVSDGQAVARG